MSFNSYGKTKRIISQLADCEIIIAESEVGGGDVKVNEKVLFERLMKEKRKRKEKKISKDKKKTKRKVLFCQTSR